MGPAKQFLFLSKLVDHHMKVRKLLRRDIFEKVGQMDNVLANEFVECVVFGKRRISGRFPIEQIVRCTVEKLAEPTHTTHLNAGQRGEQPARHHRRETVLH